MNRNLARPDATGKTAKQEKYEKKMAKYAANKARKEQKKNERREQKKNKNKTFNYSEYMNAPTATGKATAPIYSYPELFYITSRNYESVYEEAKDYSKYIGIDNLLKESNDYTFATDMLCYIGDTKELNSYIKRMLEQYCHNSKQAYYELIMACICMCEVFSHIKMEKEFECVKKWMYKLRYDPDFYKGYITEKEFTDFLVLH